MYYVTINVRKMESLTIGVGQILMRKIGTTAHQVCIANVAWHYFFLFKNSLRNLKNYSSPGFGFQNLIVLESVYH